MTNYYSKRDAKVNIAHELMNRGWKVYGYKKDESDSMTDYYSPANWDGIATKNGYVLVVDNRYNSNSGKDITKYTGVGSLSQSDRNKIEALKNMTQENGATEGEENNAKNLIEKIESKRVGSGWEVIGQFPVYQANSKGTIWHIEKDGALVDKGNQLTIFSDIPESYEFDINTMEFTDSYRYRSIYNYETGEYERAERTLSEKEDKAIKAFKTFILRIERSVNGMNTMSDGTEETNKKAMEQQSNEKLEKVIERKVKKVTKPIEVNRKMVQVGDIIKSKNYYCFWKVIEVNEERKTFTYEQIGKKYQELKNGKRYYNYLSKLETTDIYTIYELKEVEEVQEVEKWVRVKANKTTTKKTENVKNEVASESENNEEIIVKLNNEKNGVEIYFNNKPSEEVRNNLSKNGFRWHKLKKCWYNKQSEESINFANSLKNTDTTEEKENVNNDEIESLSESLIDKSSSLMEKYNLNSANYLTNDNYKNDLLQYLKDRNINKFTLRGIINYITNEYNFKGLQEVLNNFLTLKQDNNNSVNDNEKLLNKIDKQLESNNNKINKLSGDYLTNTWKTRKRQESRDRKRQELLKDNYILEYLKNRIEIDNISGFEKELINRILRDEFNSYYLRLTKYNQESIFPVANENWEKESEWYKEQERRIRRLNKIEIYDNRKLTNIVLNDYKYIIDNLENNFNPLEMKIKKLENEYRMMQKGDINFTPKQLVKKLIELADIKENDKILEPSAGIGFIADELKQITNNIDVVEYNHSFKELLKLKGYSVVGDDFLNYSNYNTYDKIVMNPPFSEETKHIKNAYKCLKSEGKIVAITSPHWTFANDKESIEFREWLDNTNYYETFESDIKFEKTNVNYKILVIEKLENNNSVAM